MSERDPNADKRYKSKDGRYMSREKEGTVVGGIIKVGVGATALAGAAAVAYRTGAVGKVARVADVEGRAFARAFKRTRSERDLKVSRFSEKTIDSFENNFLQERRKILGDRRQGKRAQEYTVQKELRRSREYVYGTEDSPSGLANALDDSFRAKLVLQDVKKSADQDLINHFNKIKSSMNSFTTRNLRNVTDYQMAQAMKKQGIESEDVIRKFNQIRNKYGERNLIHTNDEAALAYERLSSKVEKEAIHQIVQNQKKDRTLGRVIRGKKRATVDDMLALHKEGLHKLDEATKLNLEKAKEINSGFGDVVYDRHLFINKKGKLEDYSVFKEMSRANLDYWSRSMPGGIFHIRNYLNVKEAEEGITIRTINRGTVQSAINPYLGKSSTESLDDHYLYIKGKVYDIFNNKTINSDQALQHFNTKRDVLLTSSRFGSLPRMYRGMAGTLSPKEDRGLFARAFDLGRQDTDSLYGRAKSFFMKFEDENWGRNVGLESLKHGAADIDDYKMLKKMTEEASYKGIDSRTVDVLKPHLSQDIQELMSDRIFSFSSKKDIEELFYKIGKIETSRTLRGGNEEFIRVYREYMKSPDDFMMRIKTVGELDPFFKTPTNQVTGEDMLRQQVSSYLLEDAATNLMHKQMKGTSLENKISGYQELRNLLYQSTFSKDISKSEYKEALKSIDYAQISEMNVGGRLARDHAPVYNFNKTAEVDSMFVESMADTVRKNHTFFETYNMTPYENLIKDDYILIGKTHFGDSASAIFGLNSSLSDRFYGFSNITSQIFARREKMEDTTLFTIGQFYTGYRLQEMLSQIGLGMSDASMKSTWSMYSNLFAKRVFPAYAGYEGFKYLDWKMDEYTGRGFTERYEDMKAEDRLHTAFEMTNQDRYEVLKQQQLRPGIEHFEAMPSFFMPGIGTVNPMGEFANITTSMVTGTQTSSYDSKLSYTVEETYDDLFYGTEEVRKSRWWSAGSKSAYRGDRITEFAPNSWRLAHSDWEYSGVGLTAEEYWSHSMLPTLENPLGGLSFLIGLRDPYYFEKKHYHDRPYMLTGELFNTGTPILGDFGNATIGRFIKPVEQMHPDYWDGTAEVQEVRGLEYYKELAEINASFVSGKPPSFYQDIPGYALESGRELMLEEIESTTQRKPNLIERMMDEGNYVNATDLSQQRLLTQLEGPPEAFIPSGGSIPLMEGSASYLGVLENPSIANYQSDYTASLLESGQEPELNYVYNYKTDDYDYVGGAPQGNILFQNKVEVPYKYEEKYANEDFYDNMLLENVIDPRSKEWRNQEFFENITEPLGVYKWMIGDEFLGIENYQGKMVIDTAASAYDASGEFWASNLGSLGGAYSEMARRFIRRESGQLEHYNPIRNTMPDWLPGEDYFTNFLEGDPYTKIEHGERRLPGAGYESLNELHPDEFGMYGAFDRFKILADVAPWSDEYNFWSDYVQEYETDEDLRKQADVIRKQASKIKQRFDFQPYRFKDNNVQYESVTVDKVLDDYTFLTKEFGATPIRLAGLSYVNTDTGMLSSMIEPGDKVTIGIEGDPDKRIQDDTYGSMKAVLKTNLRNINQMIIEAGMAKEDMNDFSAPGVHARFTEEELAQGSRWETLAHAPTVINTKFLPVRTALEEYQRDQIYGRDWATWEDFMFRDYLIPSLEGVGRYNNPMVAVGFGATTGYVASWFLLPKGKGRLFATAAGGAVGMTGFIADEFSKTATGRSDIPLRRHQENLINEYYDFLEYLKYSALYDKGVEEYERKYGVNIEKMVRESEEEANEIKKSIDGAQRLKKWYYTNQPEDYEEKITLYNKAEEVLRENLKENNIADNAEMAQVLYYRERRDQTVYGIDPLTASREDIMKALPYKDAFFFNEFADATNKEKKRIMQIIPESHRRIYEAVWKGKSIESPDLDTMAQRFSIPDAHWDGWKPDYNLEDIKVKTVNENDNLDLTDFGFWEDDVYRGQFAPELNPRGGNVIHKSRGDVKGEIRGVLRGAGLDNIDVLITETGDRGTNMNLDYKIDRSQEIEDKLRRDISDFM